MKLTPISESISTTSMAYSTPPRRASCKPFPLDTCSFFLPKQTTPWSGCLAYKTVGAYAIPGWWRGTPERSPTPVILLDRWCFKERKGPIRARKRGQLTELSFVCFRGLSKDRLRATPTGVKEGQILHKWSSKVALVAVLSGMLALLEGCVLLGLGPATRLNPWPMFRRDPRHTGRSSFRGPQAASLRWTHSTGGAVISSPAIGGDGTIYVGSNNGNLYALNPDGLLKWTYLTGGWVYSSPAIGSDGAVYVGSWDNDLYAIGP